MDNQKYEPIIGNLVDTIGVNRSELVLEPEGSQTKFSYHGNQIARAYIKNDEIRSISLYLPRLYTQLKSFAHFPPDAIENFNIENIRIRYDIDEHPEFKDILKGLMQRNIPKEKVKWAHAHISPNKEYSISFLTDMLIFSSIKFQSTRLMNFYGEVIYMFGDSENDVCVQFDPMMGLKKLVPGIKYQPEQEHDCISGIYPFNPFEPHLFNRIYITLMTDNTPEGVLYLHENLDGLPIPSDGISLSVTAMTYHKEDGMIGFGAMNYPFLDIFIPQPESKENWLKHIEAARKLEELFKVK